VESAAGAPGHLGFDSPLVLFHGNKERHGYRGPDQDYDNHGNADQELSHRIPPYHRKPPPEGSNYDRLKPMNTGVLVYAPPSTRYI
jgi:hypothetical protein